MTNPDKIAQYIGKPKEEFTKKDLIKFIEGNNIEMINFRYVGGDGRLKTLNFAITSKPQLDQLLSSGERVDGSSLFSYIDITSSDLYIIPRYKTAFINPFSSIPAVDILCSYYRGNGVRLASSPENIIRKANQVLKDNTGLTLEAMGELEYYVICDNDPLYPASDQKGYQESYPFIKWEKIRSEAMQAITQAGGKIKYGHSEVGNIHNKEFSMEQHEIEFLPVPIEDAADYIAIARWMLRVIGYKHGVTISFAPKVSLGHAGNGLHIHTRLTLNGNNMIIDKNHLSDTARKAIAGYLTLSPSLTAFGNTVPTSYLRLVTGQEAPTNICWGDRNRSALVRIPLGWLNVKNMAKDANPLGKSKLKEYGSKQTVEFRCPDGSANIYLLLAGLAVAARHGLEMKDALKLANKLYIDTSSNKGNASAKKMPRLPNSCWKSAENLLKDRKIYKKDGVFPENIIEGIAQGLKNYEDKNLSKKLYGNKKELQKLISKYLHCS